ncbi:MAG TPA: hypothetical protein VK558_10175 [Patescibacteria group bacterium]|nr:hypothetical protein [Patescibacteria group bacterium]
MENFLRRAGQVVQGLALGTLLFSAIVMMVQIESGARVFRYQGF